MDHRDETKRNAPDDAAMSVYETFASSTCRSAFVAFSLVKGRPSGANPSGNDSCAACWHTCGVANVISLCRGRGWTASWLEKIKKIGREPTFTQLWLKSCWGEGQHNVGKGGNNFNEFHFQISSGRRLLLLLNTVTTIQKPSGTNTLSQRLSPQ